MEENVNSLAFYSVDRLVGSERVNFDKRMSIPGIITEFQDAVLDHSSVMKIDRKVIFPMHNAYWVISKLHMDIKTYPLVDDVITVKTWPLKPSFVIFERECGMYLRGELAVSVCTEWCIVDGTTLRIRRSDSIDYPKFEHEARRFQDDYARFIMPKTSEEDFKFSHTVGINDLDMNVHMNNIAYVRLAVDTFSMEEYLSRPIKAVDVAFRAQSFIGDELLVYRKDAGSDVFVTEKKRDGSVVFEMKFSR